MAFDYAALRDETVEPLIEEFGDVGQLKLIGESLDQPYESQLDNGGECEISIKYIRTMFEKADNNGTLIEQGDILILVSTQGVSIDPELAQRVIMNCKEYQVIRIDPLKPGPIIMLWKIHARK